MFRFLLLGLLTAVQVAAEDVNPLDQTSYMPVATGLVILRFGPDAQAEKMGLKLGDIITSYSGQPTLKNADLIAAVEANKADVPVVIRRGEQTLTVTAKPGKLGVYLSPVEIGKIWSLPPATAVTFATERLQATPVDTWYSFVIDGKKVGAEHAHLERQADRLTITIEVMFDGGKQWGLNHMIETGVLDVSKGIPRVITQVHEAPLFGFRSSGRWKDAETWELTIDDRNEDGTPNHEVLTSPASGPLINDYSSSYLATVMPTTPGACHHTRTVILNSAQPTGWSAILVVGPEEITVGEEKTTAVRVEQHTLRGTGWIAWVRDGEIVKHDYSGGKGSTLAYRTTQAQALVGLDPKLVPRTGK